MGHLMINTMENNRPLEINENVFFIHKSYEQNSTRYTDGNIAILLAELLVHYQS